MLTQTTTDIIETLATKVRLLTTHQIADTWYAKLRRPMESANRVARKLVAEGLAEKIPAVLTVIDVQNPLLRWYPETPKLPDFQKLSYANCQRWQTSSRPTTVLRATNNAHGIFGGTPRQVRSRELEHDATVSAVYLEYRKCGRHWTDAWTLEDSLSSRAFLGRLPDAVVTGKTPTVLDVIGRGYDASKIESIFTHFRDQLLELR